MNNVIEFLDLPIPIKGFESKYLLFPSAQIWSLKYDKFLKTSRDKDGYFKIGLCIGHSKQKQMFIHRLLADHFIKGRTLERNQVNHKDGNKQNNSFDNLEWVSPKENSVHAWEMGLNNGRPGEAHHNVKLTEKDIREIRRCYKTKEMGYRRLAKKYGVNASTIQKIQWGQRWKHITD